MSGAQPIVFQKLRSYFDRRKIILLIALVITSLVVTGFVWSQKKVSIIADGKTISIETFRNDPKEILAQADIHLGPKDEYRLSTQVLANGTTIEVYRAVPVTVLYQGKTEVIITGKPTVGELSQSLGFTEANSKTLPSEGTKITQSLTIKILAVAENLVKQTQNIAPPVVRKPDANLEKDVEEVVESGKEGIKEVIIKQRFEDGIQVAADIVAETITTMPVPRTVRVGTRDTIQTSRGAIRYSGVHVMEATAYTPYDGSDEGLTASGIPARRGVVAVDPRVIPLGSRVYIPGYGLAIAADTGGDIKGNRIDLCVESRNEAFSFGRRDVKVYVIAD